MFYGQFSNSCIQQQMPAQTAVCWYQSPHKLQFADTSHHTNTLFTHSLNIANITYIGLGSFGMWHRVALFLTPEDQGTRYSETSWTMQSIHSATSQKTSILTVTKITIMLSNAHFAASEVQWIAYKQLAALLTPSGEMLLFYWEMFFECFAHKPSNVDGVLMLHVASNIYYI